MKMRFSNKDLLLLFGIVIAVIIALTTMVFREVPDTSHETTQNAARPNTSLNTNGIIQKAIDRIEFNSLIR